MDKTFKSDYVFVSGAMRYWLTLLAVSVILYDLLMTFYAITYLGAVEMNPLYYVGGFPLLIFVNLVAVMGLYILERFFVGKKFDKLKLVIIYAIFFRLGIVLGFQVYNWLVMLV